MEVLKGKMVSNYGKQGRHFKEGDRYRKFLKGFYYESVTLRFSLLKAHSGGKWIKKEKAGIKKLGNHCSYSQWNGLRQEQLSGSWDMFT